MSFYVGRDAFYARVNAVLGDDEFLAIANEITREEVQSGKRMDLTRVAYRFRYKGFDLGAAVALAQAYLYLEHGELPSFYEEANEDKLSHAVLGN